MQVLGRVLVFSMFVIAAVGTYAQDSQVSGQIRDTTKAAVEAAKVTITRAETGDR